MQNIKPTRVTETLLSDLQGQRYDSPAKVLCLKNKMALALMQRDRYKLDMHESDKKLKQVQTWNQRLTVILFILIVATAIGGAHVCFWY